MKNSKIWAIAFFDFLAINIAAIAFIYTRKPTSLFAKIPTFLIAKKPALLFAI